MAHHGFEVYAEGTCVGVWARAPICGHFHQDDRGVRRAQPVIGNAELFHRSGGVVFVDDVRNGYKPAQSLHAFRAPQVHGKAFLVAVEAYEGWVVVPGLFADHASWHPAAPCVRAIEQHLWGVRDRSTSHRLKDERVFGLDDFGAKVAQEHRCERPCPDDAQVDDTDAFEGFGGHRDAPEPEMVRMMAALTPASPRTSSVCWPSRGAGIRIRHPPLPMMNGREGISTSPRSG